jgi:hypothetical protein
MGRFLCILVSPFIALANNTKRFRFAPHISSNSFEIDSWTENIPILNHVDSFLDSLKTTLNVADGNPKSNDGEQKKNTEDDESVFEWTVILAFVVLFVLYDIRRLRRQWVARNRQNNNPNNNVEVVN